MTQRLSGQGLPRDVFGPKRRSMPAGVDETTCPSYLYFPIPLKRPRSIPFHWSTVQHSSLYFLFVGCHLIACFETKTACSAQGAMDFSSLKDQVSNLTLYDLKAGVRKVQNGRSPVGEVRFLCASSLACL